MSTFGSQREHEVFIDRDSVASSGRRISKRGLGLNTPFNFKDDFQSEDIPGGDTPSPVLSNAHSSRGYREDYSISNNLSDYDSDTEGEEVIVLKRSKIWLFFELILYIIGGVGGLFLIGINWAFIVVTHGKTAILTVVLIVAYLVYFGFVAKVILEYVTQTLTITEDSIRLRTGVIAVKTKEVFWEKVNSVSVNQSVLARILFYGDIQITVGNDEYATFKAVHSPGKVKSFIGEKISASRRKYARDFSRDSQ